MKKSGRLPPERKEEGKEAKETFKELIAANLSVESTCLSRNRKSSAATTVSYSNHPFFQESSIEGSIFRFFVLTADDDESGSVLKVTKVWSRDHQQMIFHVVLMNKKGIKLVQLSCDRSDALDLIRYFGENNPSFGASAELRRVGM